METHARSTNPNRVVVGLSGGVDSAVAAALLLEAGFEVQGVALHLWQAPFAETGSDPLTGAQAVAVALGIPLTVIDLRTRFYREVVQLFADDYAKGLTPNPCVCCNPTLKFAALLAAADQAHARWMATGHYARVEQLPDGSARLLRARSSRKDQSYALYRLTQDQLTRLRLPLGKVQDKAEVRALARRRQLPGAEQRDSQDLCFLRGGDYRPLIRALRPDSLRPGPIRNAAGKILGEHRGLPLYTVGQRGGLGIATGERLYVLELRPQDNTLIVGPAQQLERGDCPLEAITFIQGAPPTPHFEAEVRIRYQSPPVPATIHILPEQNAHVTFSAPQRGVAPGQSIVFYQGDVVLGGGVITRREVEDATLPSVKKKL